VHHLVAKKCLVIPIVRLRTAGRTGLIFAAATSRNLYANGSAARYPAASEVIEIQTERARN